MMNDRYNTDDLQKLTDEFIKFKRYVEDALENQQTGLNSGSVKKLIAEYGSTSSAGFDAYADAEKAIAEMFAKFEAKASSSIAGIRVMAENNKTEISLLSSTVKANGVSISSIRTITDASGAFINLLAYSGNKNIDTSKGYYYDGSNDEYVFYDFENKPVRLSSYEFAGIYIEAMNNGATSELTSVRLNANVIKFGDYASVDNYGNFYAKRLWGDSSGTATIDGITYPGFFYAEIGSGGFNSADQLVGANLYVKDYEGNIMYGFQHKFTEGEDADSVNFIAGGASVWGYNYGQYKLYPKGTWNFSSCSVEGLGLVPVFG